MGRGCWVKKGFIYQTQEASLFPAGTGKALKDVSRGITRFEIRFKHIILQALWKVDWRETGGRETSWKMPERVIVHDDEGLASSSCSGEGKAEVDVRESGHGSAMSTGVMGGRGAQDISAPKLVIG